MSPAEQVFEFWLAYQKRPDLCKLTVARRKLLKRALKDYDALDLCALVKYAYEANEPGPKYWRGDNRQDRTYLDLVNLLSDAARLPGRVEKAVTWLDAREAAPATSQAIEDDPTAFLAALARRAPGETPALATTKESSALRMHVRKSRPTWE